jgi:hypothetical protein
LERKDMLADAKADQAQAIAGGPGRPAFAWKRAPCGQSLRDASWLNRRSMRSVRSSNRPFNCSIALESRASAPAIDDVLVSASVFHDPNIGRHRNA